MSENVKRYDEGEAFDAYGYIVETVMQEDEDGEYVKYEDYAALQESAARAEKLKDEYAKANHHQALMLSGVKGEREQFWYDLRTALGFDPLDDSADCLGKIKEIRTTLAAAEERADRAEKRSQFNKDNHLAAEKEIERITADLRTLRRTSVRAFSLERYIGLKAREAMREINDPSEEETGLYILEGIESIIARRIRRSTTNTKGRSDEEA